MKLHILVIPALLAAGSLSAQEVQPAENAPEAPAKLTIDAPIEALMADAEAKAVVDANLPGLEDHPAYGQFKAMSLKAVQPFSGGVVTDEILAKITEGLAKL